MNYETICQEVCNIARLTGGYIRQELKGLTEDHIQLKGKRDMVTYVDKTAEIRIVDALINIIPGAGFVVEERTVKEQNKEFTWIIDPLDGTTNYIHKIPVFSVSIALKHHEDTVIGVVYEINSDECFYSYDGSDAFLNGEKIAVSSVHTIDKALIATGFPYSGVDDFTDYLKLLTAFLENSHGVRRLGSAAVDLAYVACGRFDGFYEAGLNIWDVAAGAYIVKQAGGIVTDFSGASSFLLGKEILASNALLFPRFFSMVNSFLKTNCKR
ncbi:MAG: inositol monophosphatase family protein [Bacteroidales bacterium]|nr:inositol monophosphatase family protein [Bacteroidales bacterium]